MNEKHYLLSGRRVFTLNVWVARWWEFTSCANCRLPYLLTARCNDRRYLSNMGGVRSSDITRQTSAMSPFVQCRKRFMTDMSRETPSKLSLRHRRNAAHTGSARRISVARTKNLCFNPALSYMLQSISLRRAHLPDHSIKNVQNRRNEIPPLASSDRSPDVTSSCRRNIARPYIHEIDLRPCIQ